MRNRFSKEKKLHNAARLLLSACLFAAILFVFWLGVSSLASRTDEEELATLEQAVSRGITRCYALEGSYPRSLDYLKENYGLIYNEGKYTIHYIPLGANMMPEVTIIRRTDKQGGVFIEIPNTE